MAPEENSLDILLRSGKSLDEIDMDMQAGVTVADQADVVKTISEIKGKLELSKSRSKDESGNPIYYPAPSAKNLLTIFNDDPKFSKVKLNEIGNQAVKVSAGKLTPWTDDDDSDARVHVELEYNIRTSESRFRDAFVVFLRGRSFNPILDEIRKTVWDGVRGHCENFLSDILKAERSEYVKECSRLLFAGGIGRLMEPGCKFDSVISLIGGQGAGKTTVCQWLALSNAFYTSLKTISGKPGLENITGKWLVEIEELLAILANERSGTRAEDQAKAYLSSTVDFWRESYGRRAADHPRTCFFVGTTNRESFLTDRTGNRRWYPVKVFCNAATDIFPREKQIKAEIRQCWAEMLHAYEAGDQLASLTERRELLNEIRASQSASEVEDPRVGIIEHWLSEHGKQCVCIQEIWQECLHEGDTRASTPGRKDSQAIAEILVQSLGWTRDCEKATRRFGRYGPQRAFLSPEPVDDTIPPF